MDMTKNNMNETTVAFIIYDYDGDFDQLTENIAINPTYVTEADLLGARVRRWEVASGVDEKEELEEHISVLLEKLSPSAKQIKELSLKYRCVISVGVKYHEYNPEIVLTPENIEILASLGVKLWLDLYNDWDGETEHDYDHEESKL
jgi:hypothetical protein